MQPTVPNIRRRIRVLLVLGAAACSGCTSLAGGGAQTPSGSTASGGAPTVTEDATDSVAPAAQAIGGTNPIPTGR